MAKKGGQIKPDNRPASAKGVGKNSKRHDLERQVPPVSGSRGMVQGDKQELEQGNRVAPKQQNPTAVQQGQSGGQSAPSQSGGGGGAPDAIEFIGNRNKLPLGTPASPSNIGGSKAHTWLPLIRQLVTGPGASGALTAAYVNQARSIVAEQAPATVIDLDAADAAIEAMLNEGI